MGLESWRCLPIEHAILCAGKCRFWVVYLEKLKSMMQNVLMCNTLHDTSSVKALKNNSWLDTENSFPG